MDNNININTMATMCQGSRLLGMSKSNEHTLESYFRKIVKDNGPEFLVTKLKVLKSDTIRRLEDPEYTMPKDQVLNGISTPCSWSRKYNRPKGPLSIIYKTWKKDSTRLRGIGMLINSIAVDHATEKQITKFLDGVNTDGRDSDDKVLPITNHEAQVFVDTVNKQLKHQDMYSGLDLTGDLLPIGNITQSISGPKKDLLSKDPATRHRAIARLSHAYDAQWKSAPRLVTNYIRSDFDAFRGVKVHKDTGEVARDYEYSSQFKAYGRHINDDYAGTVSFLEKPGAKLRSVYNTNRVVDYAMTPYAKGVEHAFYNAYSKNIFVKRQDKGMEAIQQMLKHHRTLTSADLSSATDRLNFRAFTNGLRIAILNNATHKVLGKHLNEKAIRKYQRPGQWAKFSSVHPDIVKSSDIKALKSIDIFERTAEMPFYSKDLDSAVGLRTGQPLGMMGSFQTLTAMNYCMGREAEKSTFGDYSSVLPSFAVVGDDFVGDSDIMPRYHEIVTSLNGKDNHEKALTSDKYGEFCSHLITKDKVIAFKPRFHLGHDALWLNAEKTSVNKTLHVYRLRPEDKESLRILASIGDPSLDEMGSVSTSKRYPQQERHIIQAALAEISMDDSSFHDPITISRETEELSREEDHTDSRYAGTREDFRVYTDTDNGRVYTGLAQQVSGYNNSNQYSVDQTKYDHKLGHRVVKKSFRKQASEKKHTAELAKKLVADYEDNKIGYIPLPYHKSSKLSTTEILSQAVSAMEGTRAFVHRQPYPDANRDNEDRNPIDRSRKYHEHVFDPSYVDYTIKANSHAEHTDHIDQAQHKVNKVTSKTSVQNKEHHYGPVLTPSQLAELDRHDAAQSDVGKDDGLTY